MNTIPEFGYIPNKRGPVFFDYTFLLVLMSFVCSGNFAVRIGVNNNK